MKPIIAFFTDTHFGNKGQSHSMFLHQMKFFECQFFPYILDNDIKIVLCCGDFFHDRNKTDWYILNELKRRFFQWFDDNEIELHILIGNHDTVYKHTLEENSLTETTRIFKNIYVYTEPTKVNISPYTIGFNPWIIDNKNPKLTERVDICLGHFNVFEFPMMKGIYSKDGLKHSQFTNYKLSLSGHFHIRSQRDNFHMLGTPFQLNWGDFNLPKGFMVLDNNFNYEYIQNNITPQFVKLYYDNDNISVIGLDYTEDHTQISKEESLEIVKKNYCRLFTKSVEDQSKLDAYHNSLLQVSLDDYKIDIVSLNDVVEEFDNEQFDESFENGETTLTQILSCIDGMTFSQEYDKSILADLARQEYKEAHQEVLGID